MPKHLHDLSAPPKEAHLFDTWFFQQPKHVQATMRECNVLPYREAWKPRHVFDVDPDHEIWQSDEPAVQLVSKFEPVVRKETESFMTREHVGRMVRGFIDALSCSNSFQVRRHVELTRWALGLPGRLPATIIARMYGITKQAVHKRAANLRQQISPDALGWFPKPRKRRIKRN